MKFNPTNQHFRERRPDRVVETGERIPIPPLHKSHLAPHCWGEIKPSRRCTYENIIEPLRTMPRCFRIFLDTGFITSHEIPRELWELLLEKRLFISKGVRGELQPWLDSPRCNHWFRDYLVNAIREEEEGLGHDVVSIAAIDDFPASLVPVAAYYIRTLWLRKYFAVDAHDRFLAMHGRAPDIDKELKPDCQKIVGGRGWRIAQKVLRERHKPSALVPVDEALIVTAVFHSLLYGQPSITLTRDNDVFEQWCKCIYLIDTHYQAMLLADEFARDPSRFTTMPAPPCDALYDGDENLLINLQFNPSELRRRNVEPIQATCALLSTSDAPLTQSERTFGLVEDMGRLLDIKAKTRGRNTDRFGNKNFHAELDPRHIAFGTSGPALVNEKTVATSNVDDLPISVTDTELALFTSERFSQQLYQYEAE